MDESSTSPFMMGVAGFFTAALVVGIIIAIGNLIYHDGYWEGHVAAIAMGCK